MPSNTHDLDALLGEIEAKGETVTLFGKEWKLPPDVDAETMLRVQRLQMKIAIAQKRGVQLDDDDVIDDALSLDEVVRRMAGDENFEAWQAEKWTGPDGTERTGLGYRGLQAVAGTLYAIHNGVAGGQGKGQKRGPGKPTQKRTGSGR